MPNLRSKLGSILINVLVSKGLTNVLLEINPGPLAKTLEDSSKKFDTHLIDAQEQQRQVHIL